MRVCFCVCDSEHSDYTVLLLLGGENSIRIYQVWQCLIFFIQAQNLDVSGVQKLYRALGLAVPQETVTSTLWFTLREYSKIIQSMKSHLVLEIATAFKHPALMIIILWSQMVTWSFKAVLTNRGWWSFPVWLQRRKLMVLNIIHTNRVSSITSYGFVWKEWDERYHGNKLK